LPSSERPSSGPRTELILLGGPTLVIDGVEIELPAKPRALLGLVGTVGTHAATREWICGGLWADRPRRAAAHALSQLVYSLRVRWGVSLVAAEGDSLRLRGNGFDSDVLRLEAAIRSGTGLESAVAGLDRGLLPRSRKDLTEEANDWLDRRLLQWRRELRERISVRLREAETAALWERAAELCAALQALDPTDEAILQQLLHARGMAGQVRESEAAYRSFDEEMRLADSRWHPARETVRVLERVRSTGISLPRSTVSLPGRPALVGRSSELATLRSALRTLPGGDGGFRVVIIEGGAGVGKTRLMEEALADPSLSDAVVLRADPGPLEPGVPLGALTDLLDHEAVRVVARELPNPWRGYLNDAFPGLVDAPSGGEAGGIAPAPGKRIPPRPRPVSRERRRPLLDAVQRLLEQMAGRGTLILVVDGLQWVDAPSLRALEHIRRRWRGGSVHALLLLRSDTPARSVRSKRSIATIRELGDARLRLPPLDPEAARSLLQGVPPAADGRPIPRSVVPTLLRLAGGRPGYLLALVSELQAGRLALPRRWIGPLHELPAALFRPLAHRLAALSPEAERCATVLGAFGTALPPRTLARLAGVSGGDLPRAIETLSDLGIAGWSAGQVRLEDELAGQLLLGRLTAGHRTRLHARIAADLARSTPPDPSLLAVHLDEAGRGEEAYGWALRAADEAEARGGDGAAVAHFLGRARAHAPDATARAHLDERLARSLLHLHDPVPAVPLLKRAAEGYAAAGLTGAEGYARILALDALARSGGVPQGALFAEAMVLRAEASAAGRWEAFVLALDAALRIADRLGWADEARRLLRSVGDLPEGASPAARARAAAMGAFHLSYGDPGEALACVALGVRVAEEVGDVHLLLHCAQREFATSVHLGRVTDGAGKTIRDLLERTGSIEAHFEQHAAEAEWALGTGELDRGREALHRAERILRDVDPSPLDALLLLDQGAMALESGDPEGASRSMRRLVAEGIEELPWGVSTCAHAGLALLALEVGAAREAEDWASRVGDVEGREHLVRAPAILVRFLALRALRAHGEAAAVEEVRRCAVTLRERRPLVWLRLKLLEHRILRVRHPRAAQQVALEGLEVARLLSLPLRTREFADRGGVNP